MRNFKKTLKLLLFTTILSVGFCFFVTPGKTSTASSEKDILADAVSNKLSGSQVIKKVYFTDFDKNGRNEAFILTGEKETGTEDDFSTIPHKLWFAYMENGEPVTHIVVKDSVMIYSSKPLKLKSTTLFCAGIYAATSYPQYVYCVSGNHVKKIFTGDDIKYTGGNTFTSIHSTYDLGKYDGILMGHTWKPYYFYYKNGKVNEYKGKKISLKKFKKYSNANKMLKKYKNMVTFLL